MGPCNLKLLGRVVTWIVPKLTLWLTLIGYEKYFWMIRSKTWFWIKMDHEVGSAFVSLFLFIYMHKAYDYRNKVGKKIDAMENED